MNNEQERRAIAALMLHALLGLSAFPAAGTPRKSRIDDIVADAVAITDTLLAVLDSTRP